MLQHNVIIVPHVRNCRGNETELHILKVIMAHPQLNFNPLYASSAYLHLLPMQNEMPGAERVKNYPTDICVLHTI